MTRKLSFLFPLLLLAIVLSAFAAPGIAAGPSPQKSMPVGTEVVLDNGETATFLGKDLEGNYHWQTTISAPQYLGNLDNPIVCRWQYDVDKKQWQSSPNLFDATVKDTKVTVTYQDKKLSWKPDVYLGNKKLDAGWENVPTYDPINENYIANTMQWYYGNGITRSVRIIEGMLIEYYTLQAPLAEDLTINSHTTKDLDFVWTRPIVAWDAEGNSVELWIDGSSVILATEAMAKAVYPITIDPDHTFTTSDSDALMKYSSLSYTTAHNSSTSSNLYNSITSAEAGQAFYSNNYYVIFRSVVYFDTSSLGSGANVTSATLRLNVFGVTTDRAYNMVIQSGMPTYPHDPCVAADYNMDNWAGSGGTIASSSVVIDAYNNITLNSTWVNTTSYTKLCLRSSRDIDISAPTEVGSERVAWYAYEQGDGYWPELVVTYTSAATPTITSNNATQITMATARLNSYLDDDGGEPCDVRFEYDIDSGAPYANSTAWVNDTYSTGSTPYADIANLIGSTTYYFRAQAGNDQGITNGTELTFETLNAVGDPSNLIAYPANATMSLTWAKGTGSVRTIIRAQIGTYPSNYTEGEQVYFGTQQTAAHTDLTPGTNYYYRAWGEDSGNWSASYAETMATTIAGGAAGDVPDAPPVPSFWFGSPDYTQMADFPLYTIINDAADEWSIPRNSFWLVLALSAAALLGLFVYSVSHSGLAALIVAMIAIGFMAASELLPLWMAAIFAMIAIGIIVAERRA